MPTISEAQAPYHGISLQDSLVLAEGHDSLNLYIGHLRTFARSLSGRSDKNQIIVDTFHKYSPYREPITRAEHTAVRGWYASLLYSERQIYGDLALNMDLAMEATKYNYNLELVDKNGKFIEQALADFYARTDDHDQSIFWYKIMIPGLKQRKDYDRLCLIFKSISNAYAFKYDIDRAGDYLDSTRLYLPLTKGERARLAFQVTELEQIQPKERGETWEGKLLTLLDELERSKWKKYRGAILKLLVEHSLSNEDYQSAERYLFLKRKLVWKEDQLKFLKREMAKLELELAKIARKTSQVDSFSRRMDRSFLYLTGKTIDNYNPSKDMYPENTLVTWWQIKGENDFTKFQSDSRLENLTESIEALENAIKTNNLIRDPILQSKSKSLSVSLTRQLYDDLISRCISLFQIEPTEKTLAKIEKAVINSNDYSLLSRNEFNIAKSMLTTAEQATIAHLQKELAGKQHALFSSDQTKGDSLQLELLELRKKIQTIVMPAIDSVEVKSLEISEPYLTIFRTEEKVYTIFKAVNKQIFIQSNPTAKLDDHMKLFRRLILRYSEIEELNDLLTQMYNDLMPQNVVLPESYTVFLDGALADFPIELLRKNKRYLLEDHKIQYFQVNTDEQSSNSSQGDRNWLFVRPEYPKDSRSFAMLDENARSGFYNLAFAQKEVQSIANVLREESDILEIVELEVLDSMIQSSDILHFAGHGKAWADSAYLVLHHAKGYEKWHAGQISEKSYDLDLVTLSACETGLGEYVSGDGIQSIGRSFLAAGSRAVCYTLWTVNDNATSDLMTAFYKNIRKGMPKNEALQKAKLKYLAQASPEKRHPYFWAGIVIQGNNGALFKEPTLTYFRMLMLLSIGIIISLLLLIKRKIKR